MVKPVKFSLLLFFCLYLCSNALANPRYPNTPDGLVLLVADNSNGTFGYGHGYIIGNKVISAAHVLNKNINRLFVSQNGRLKEITSDIIGRPTLHSVYLDPDLNLPGLLPENHSQHALDVLRGVATIPFDIGFINLATSPDTDFILPSTRNLSEYLTYSDASGIIEDSEAIVSFQSSEMFPNQRSSEIREGMRIRVRTNQLPGDIDIGKMPFYSEVQMQRYEGGGDDANLLMFEQRITAPGQSGSPLVTLLPSGKLSVLGMVNSTNAIDVLPGDAQTFFSTQMELVKFLEQAENSGLTPGTCRSLLGK